MIVSLFYYATVWLMQLAFVDGIVKKITPWKQNFLQADQNQRYLEKIDLI